MVVNAGVANAEDRRRVAAAEATAAVAADALGLEREQVVVLSTGVIGVPLPLERMLPGTPPRGRSRRTAARRPRRRS